MKQVDISYYGNCDEDDGVILPQEAAYEEKLMARKAEIWKRRHDEEAAGRKAAYLRSKQYQEDLEEDDENPDEKDIYDTGDNPADTELLKLYAEIEKDADMKKTLDSEITVHASLAMALSSVEEEEEELDLAKLLKTKSGRLRPGEKLKRTFVAHTAVPSQKQVEEALVEQRKRLLLEQYMTPEFLASVSDTGKLLGVERNEQPPTNAANAEGEEREEEEEEEEEDEDELAAADGTGADTVA
nr:unnamed protein product [Spirometra erinaceieuropaei]